MSQQSEENIITVEHIAKYLDVNKNSILYGVHNRVFYVGKLLALYPVGTTEEEAVKLFTKQFHDFCDDGGHYLCLYKDGIPVEIITSTEEEYHKNVKIPIQVRRKY